MLYTPESLYFLSVISSLYFQVIVLFGFITLILLLFPQLKKFFFTKLVFQFTISITLLAVGFFIDPYVIALFPIVLIPVAFWIIKKFGYYVFSENKLKSHLVTFGVILLSFLFLSLLPDLVLDKEKIIAEAKEITSPAWVAATKIKLLFAKLGVPERTDLVAFSPGFVINAEAIAPKTGVLGKEQVCLLASGEGLQSFVVNDPGKIIEYSGTARVEKRLYVLCENESKFASTIAGLSKNAKSAFENFSVCGFSSTSQETACIVSVVPLGN